MHAAPPATTKATEDDSESWAVPMPGENQQWFQRFSLYAALGAGRSVRAVYNAELAERGRGAEHSKPVPSSWSQASHRFDWLRRAAAFDAWRRAQVFNAGNAQDTERIKKLDALIEKLCERCMAMLELPYEETTFDPDAFARLVTALLAAIDMLAKHTGGYAPQRVEHSGKDGGAIQVEQEETMRVIFYMPDITEISGGEDVSGAGQSDEHGEQQ